MRADVLLLDAGDVAGAARRLRDTPTAHLEEHPPVALRRAAQLLRAGAYSAETSARRFERIANEVEARMQAAKP